MEQRDGDWWQERSDLPPELVLRYSPPGTTVWSSVESRVVYLGRTSEASLRWNEDMAATRPEEDSEMGTNYSECEIEENVGGVGFVVRDGGGGLVTERHGVPVGFVSRGDAETWLTAQRRRQEQEREEGRRRLAEELLRELGELGPFESVGIQDLVDGFIANHGRTLIAEAASGDVAALVQLRHQCGLAPIV